MKFKGLSLTFMLLGLIIISLTACTTTKPTNEVNWVASNSTKTSNYEINHNQIPSDQSLTREGNENKLVMVNSSEPIPLNQELVDKAKNSQDVSEFRITSDSDIASIAYGRILKALAITPVNEQAKGSFYPAAPIKVKSYEWRYPDYYIVPFVRDGKFVAQAILSTDREKKGYFLSEENGYIDPVSELFNVDAKEAMQIIESKKGITQPPVPRLVFHTDLTHFTQQNNDRARREPAWEFDLPDHSKLYVNQYGEVLDKNIIPWYETITSPQYIPEAVRTQANQLIRNDGWDLQVEKIEFGRPIPNDERHRRVIIYLIAENQAGPDQFFMPKGSIVSLKSSGGKIYSLQPIPIDNTYISTQQLRIEENRPEIKPGQAKFAFSVEADVLDTEFTEVSYRDELGNEFNIPLELTPVNAEGVKSNTQVMKSYHIPGKNWSIAITKLEFRTGTWQDKKLAALELTVSNNDGPDKTFLPTGKVIGLVGTSGKLYPGHDSTLDENYRGLEKYMAEKGQTMYRPGILIISPEILVDAGEKNFTQIIYQDETGKKFTIPVQGIIPLDK